MNIKYQMNNRSILVDPSKPSNGQEIDIYLTDYNIGIEVNPAYSHNSNKYRIPKFKKMTVYSYQNQNHIILINLSLQKKKCSVDSII